MEFLADLVPESSATTGSVTEAGIDRIVGEAHKKRAQG